MTMTKIEKAIIRAIIMAQIASDSGKGIHRIYLPGGNFPGATGYKSKEFYELRALRMIRTNPRCGINYWCEIAPDQNGFPSVLVYFDIRVDGTRYQISFHNPKYTVPDFVPYLNTGRKTRWARSTSCYSVCEELAEIIGR